MNRTQLLTRDGQSLWLDFIKRSFLAEERLRALVDFDNVTGVTSNPAIFDEALAEGDDYDASLRESAENNEDPAAAYRRLAIADVQTAADTLFDVYQRTDRRDGFVSLEVSPHLAHDTEASVAEGRALWDALDRPNVMIKIPGTKAGLSAITQLIASGINVNVTLLFGISRYEEAAEACLNGIEKRIAARQPVDAIASVASFFLSRIDVHVDKQLDAIAKKKSSVAEKARALKGQTAIANAKVAYEVYETIFHGERFAELAEAGAQPQRLLWASTSTKNPDERDTRYVEALIGPETVTTVPLKTLEAFRDHGDPASRLAQGRDEARRVLQELAEIGIDLPSVASELEEEGLEKFRHPFDHMLSVIEEKLARVRA